MSSISAGSGNPQPASPNPQSAVQNQPHLERRLGLLNATSINMSNMVGTGPFITLPLIISSMAGPQALLGWVVGAVIAIADGMVWSELSAALPGSGGSYVYLRDSFGRHSWGRLWAFLFIFQLVCSGPLEIASGNIAIAQYLGYLLPGMTAWQAKFLAAGAGVLATILLYRKITSIARLMMGLWIGMLVTVGWVIVSGLLHFNPSIAFDFPADAFSFGRGFFLGLTSATLYVMYCYLGYYGVCYLGDEVKQPERTIPRALVISILGVLVINFLISLSIIGVIPWRQILNSQFVAAEAMQKIYGRWAGAAITLLIVWTAFASIYALILTYSRVPFAAAQDGNFFRLFGKLHPAKDFPHFSLLLIGGLSALASFFELADVISALMTARILVQFCGQIVALEFLHRYHPEIPRPFRMWFYPLPSALALLGWLAIFLNSASRYIVYGLATMGFGVLAYLFMARKTGGWPFPASRSLTGLLVLVSLWSLAACGGSPAGSSGQASPITWTAIQDGEIWFRNLRIQLRFDSEMYCRVFLQKEGKLHSINDIPPNTAIARPPHFLTLNGEEIKDFQVDYRNIGVSEMRTQFGTGKRLHLPGYAKTAHGVVIEKKLMVELYQEHPEIAIVSAAYRNTDTASPIEITRAPSSFFRMDAARSEAGAPSYAFWILLGQEQGAPERVGEHYEKSISFARPEETGGRVFPLVDVWTSRMGMAVGDLARCRGLMLRVSVAPDQKLEIEFEPPPPGRLGPGESFKTSQQVWIVHTGDFRQALERYKHLRQLSGRAPSS